MKRIVITLASLLLAAAASAETIAIVGGTVHTLGPQGTVENATIIIDDGRFRAIGPGLRAPDGATVIDASGKIVTPGLFSPIGELGLEEVGLSAGPVDAIQRGDRFTASFDVADAFNPRSTLIPVQRIEGVTRALIAPRASYPDSTGEYSHVISGLAAVANLGGGNDSIDKRRAALVVNLGETDVLPSGRSRLAALKILENALDEAADYAQHAAAYELGQHRDYTLSLPDLEALQPVLTGEVPMLVHVHRASDIAGVLRMADARNLRVIISGGAEAWLLADELAAANVPVLVHPSANLPTSFDRLYARSDTAAILSRAGVSVAFADAETHNARNITQSAGNATVSGMDWNAALAAITLVPAQIYGVADEVGNIVPGKRADVVIWPGDPLEVGVYPERVLIDGKDIEMVSRQTLLRDRYLSDSDKPPAWR